jgi:hypothetical protein
MEEKKKTKLTFWSSWQVRGAREEKHPPVHSECVRAHDPMGWSLPFEPVLGIVNVR